MFIVPLDSSFQPVYSVFDKAEETNKPQKSEGLSGMFKEIFAEVQENNRIVAEDNVRAAMGEIDDLHTLYLNMTKASIATETFVALKNTAVGSYEKLVNMQI